MAEIAIAAAVAAAVAAAAYTIEYALTPKAKPIEKGRLNGELLIQDSRYGHMIPILLGGEPHTATVGCNPGTLRSARWTDIENLTLRSDKSLQKTGGVAAAPDGDAYATKTWAGTQCVDIQWEATELKHTQHVAIYLEDESGASTYRNGYKMKLFFGSVPILHAVKDGADFGSFLGYSFPFAFRITTDGNGNGALWSGGTLGDIVGWPGPDLTFTYDPDLNYRLHVEVSGYDLDTNLVLDAPAAAPEVLLAAGAAVGDGTGGGLRVAGNVIALSDVRKVETITPAEGGKGFGNKNPDTKNISYFCDLAIMFGEGELGLNKLWAGTDVLLNLNTEESTNTGVRYGAVGPDDNADNINLADPSDPDIAAQPGLRFSGLPEPDATGMVSGTLNNGADFRFYSGSETQLPDPWLETVFGVGDTPAYLGRSYLVLENFEVGRYGSIPNFNALVYNLNLRTAADCLDHLFQRVGLEPTDFDVSNVDGFSVRGIPIINREGPVNTVGLIGTLFGFDVVETNGEILCIERGGAPSFAVAENDLGTVEVNDTEDPQNDDIPELVQNELDLDQIKLPRRLDLTFYDPARDGETNTQGAQRLEALGLSYVTQDLNAVLTVTEGRQLAQRLLDTAWIESAGAIHFKVPHTFAGSITAAAVGTVTRNGITHTVRVKEVNGFVPGVLEVVGLVTRAATYIQTQIVPGADAGSPLPEVTPPGIPATTVATFIDRILRDRELQDGRPGFYAAACSFGNGSWGGANVYADRGNGYVQLVNLPEQATMGIVDDTDATIAGASTVDVELYGEQTLPTGEPTYVLQGDLIYAYETATQLSTSPNLWRIEDLTNIGARCTTAENGAHAAGERFVLLNQALRFVALESDEIGVARDYKVPTVGQDIADAGVINFTVSAPNSSVTTPSDWTMTAGAGSIAHTWTPFTDDCVMTDGLIYEIRDDAAGSPGALIYSGNSQPFVEQGLSAGTYTRHFRARTRFSDGSYLMASITITGGTGSDADFDSILVDPTTMLVLIDPTTLNVLTGV